MKTLEDVDYCAPLTCTSIHDNQIGPCDVQKKFEIGPADGSYQSLGKKSRSARSIVSPIHRNPFRFPVVVNIFLNLIRVIFGSRPLLEILRIYRTQSIRGNQQTVLSVQLTAHSPFFALPIVMSAAGPWAGCFRVNRAHFASMWSSYLT